MFGGRLAHNTGEWSRATQAGDDHGRVSEMVHAFAKLRQAGAQRRGKDEPEVGIEGDQATVKGFVVKGIEGDAVLGVK
jgi:hypothetical protein